RHDPSNSPWGRAGKPFGRLRLFPLTDGAAPSTFYGESRNSSDEGGRMRITVVAVILCAWAGTAAGQAVVDAGPPVRRASEGLTSIFAAAELPDGRVLVVDNREPAIAVVETAGRLGRLGREGPGPEEYSLPASILRQPDGTFHVYDARNARYSVVSADGRVTGTAPLVRPELSGFSAPRGPDTEGFIYFDWRTFEPERG